MIKMKLVKDSITPSLILKEQRLKQIPVQALQEFVKLTPKDTGRARRNTTLRNEVIIADYPYARRLDEGASKQAPKGMTKPLAQWLRRRFDLIIKRK